MKTAVKEDDTIYCAFHLHRMELLGLVQRLKKIPGAQFRSDKKAWAVPYSVKNAKALENIGFSLEGELRDLIHPRKVIARDPEPQKPVDFSHLPDILRNYQKEAIQFLEYTDWKGMIALTPRLGKSLVALAGYMLHRYMPVVILTTASGKAVWEREIEKWVHDSSVTLIGTTPYEIPNTHFIIVNYDIVDDWVDEILKKEPEFLIVDECHRISNPTYYVPKSKEEYDRDVKIAMACGKPLASVKKGKTAPVKCTHAFLTLSRSIPHVVPLSGTPATTCPAQMQIPLSVLDPAHFRNRDKYLFRYCDPKKGYRGFVFEGLSHEEELIPLLSRVMFRRTKDEVFSDLPDEQHEMLPFTIDYSLYEKELAQLTAWYQAHKDVSDEVLDKKIAQFESFSYSRKRSQIIDWISDYLTSNDKLVVYTWHQVASEDIYRAFKDTAVLVYGGTDPAKRQELINDFNTNPKTKLFVGQIKACSEAISLYAADTVLYAELPETPSALQQSSERIWLPTIKRDKVFYYYAIAANTIDEKRVEVLRERAKILGILYGDSAKTTTVFANKIRSALDKI